MTLKCWKEMIKEMIDDINHDDVGESHYLDVEAKDVCAEEDESEKVTCGAFQSTSGE